MSTGVKRNLEHTRKKNNEKRIKIKADECSRDDKNEVIPRERNEKGNLTGKKKKKQKKRNTKDKQSICQSTEYPTSRDNRSPDCLHEDEQVLMNNPKFLPTNHHYAGNADVWKTGEIHEHEIRNVFVSNLSSAIVDTDLEALLADSKLKKDVQEIRVVMDQKKGSNKGFAYIECTNQEASLKVVKFLDRKLVHGVRITARASNPKKSIFEPNTLMLSWSNNKGVLIEDELVTRAIEDLLLTREQIPAELPEKMLTYIDDEQNMVNPPEIQSTRSDIAYADTARPVSITRPVNLKTACYVHLHRVDHTEFIFRHETLNIVVKGEDIICRISRTIPILKPTVLSVHKPKDPTVLHRSKIERTVYISNLAFHCTEEDLKGYVLWNFGAMSLSNDPNSPLTKVMIVQNRKNESLGYGFIEMKSNLLALELCETLNNDLFCGRPLKVVMSDRHITTKSAKSNESSDVHEEQPETNKEQTETNEEFISESRDVKPVDEETEFVPFAKPSTRMKKKLVV